MMCVSTVAYRLKVNGECAEVLLPQRGLRQGDPLSPYLLLIYAEGFSSLVTKAELEGNLKGICIGNDAPSFNHLLFEDDSLVLIKATSGSARYVQNILHIYEVWSGQVVNYDKSSVMFSRNKKPDQ